MAQAQRQWSGRTHGGNWAHRCLFVVLRHLPVGFLYPLLALVVPFYCIFNHRAFHNIYLYFNKIHYYSKYKSFFSAVKNHFVFGTVVIDRFAMMAGNAQQFHLSVTGTDYIRQMLDSPGGYVVAGSHVGNFELAGHFFSQNKKCIHIVVHNAEGEALQRQRGTSLAAHNVRMIPLSDDLSHIFKIKEVLENGDVVGLACDRVSGSSKSLTMNFLGTNAEFPLGPFVLAAQLEVPMVALAFVKQRGTRYCGIVRRLPLPDASLKLRDRARLLAEQYVGFLAEVVQKAPEQWFNFYKFWPEIGQK